MSTRAHTVSPFVCQQRRWRRERERESENERMPRGWVQVFIEGKSGERKANYLSLYALVTR